MRGFYEQICESSHIRLIEIVGKTIGTGKYILVTHSIIASPGHRHTLLYPYLREVVPKMTGGEHHELRVILAENLELFIELGGEQLCELLMRHYLLEIPRILAGSISTANIYLMVGFVETILAKLQALDHGTQKDNGGK